MTIRINSNIASLNAQRRLGQTTRELSRVSDRLASGLRINRAADDAAGLAISSSLDADARVYSQGIRNIDDAVSYLTIAEGAGTELKNILIRMRELATQASNGTYSNSQRTALNAEALTLREEYNRIVNSTEFNGRNIFTDVENVAQSGTTNVASSTINVQIGYGAQETLSIVLGEITTAYLPDGTFASGIDYFGSSTVLGGQRVHADVDNDGDIDIVSDTGTALNNGDGSFSTLISTPGLDVNAGVTLADVNNDGNLDFIGTHTSNNTVNIALGNGNGTYKAATSIASGVYTAEAFAVDLNGDGTLDLLTVSVTDQSAHVLIGNGNGTFKAQTNYSTNSNALNAFKVGDFNEDGSLDLLVGGSNVGNDRILYGNGNGTFGAPVDTTTSGGVQDLAVGDFNNDGHLDYVGTYNGQAASWVYLGNGNGTFKARSVQNDLAGYGYTVADFNGDGNLDFLKGRKTASTTSIRFGNGDGTFLAPVSYGVLAQAGARVTVGDVTGEGVIDIIGGLYSGNYTLKVLEGNFTTDLTVNTFQEIEQISLSNVTNALAAQTRLDELLTTANQTLGFIGSGMSRLLYARTAIASRRDTYIDARSRISDADIATEAASLVRLKILQQSAAAVLAQANQTPALALTLLDVNGRFRR